MTKKMLIDAAHAEEVRVCVLENGVVEDFDFETSTRRPLRGNIYLARVTRVEPSLQAAFIEYGGNRHGFLAFNEIHPDYYQIPVSDRRLLQEADAEEAALAAELELGQLGDDGEDGLEGGEIDGEPMAGGAREGGGEAGSAGDDVDEDAGYAAGDDENGPDGAGSDDSGDDSEVEAGDADEDDDDQEAAHDAAFAATALPRITAADEDRDPIGDAETDSEDPGDAFDAETASEESDEDGSDAEDAEDAEPEDADDAAAEADIAAKRRERRPELMEKYREARRKRARLLRNYKIQEVIKRRQILLVQVVKEERGNKGAALTTYLSLAGRYCVLMPNTARGGGISRKIPVAADRKRLKRVVDSLDVPAGMGLIIRTAGAKRTKAEVKRDYEYLTRLWENIRSLTLKSIAPCLIYEEANLIKRAIRDLYDKDIDQITVEGEAGYREAKDFMKMLMPSHAKNVQPYKDKAPLFLKYDVESQLDAMYQPTVRLRSGGYIVIHQTEALVAIDVNSGKATRERNIELTALKTNTEAAKEAARQCRLRDLAGLIVIDFIDMEENKNNRIVEKRFKDALKDDRARLQVGRISNFGLLEMSRQRRRSGIVDGTTHACPSCNGAGVIRSSETAALRILRAIEREALGGRAAVIAVRASLDVTLFMLNHKREWLKRIETDYAIAIEVVADPAKSGDVFDIEKRGAPREAAPVPAFVRADQTEAVEIPDEPEAVIVEDEDDEEEAAAAGSPDRQPDADGRTSRRRRRRRRGGRGDGVAQNGDARGVRPAGEDGFGDEPRREGGRDFRRDEPRREPRRDARPAVERDLEGDPLIEGDGEGQPRAEAAAGGDSDDGQRRRRRRGRRGGRRNRGRQDGAAEPGFAPPESSSSVAYSGDDDDGEAREQSPRTNSEPFVDEVSSLTIEKAPVMQPYEAPRAPEPAAFSASRNERDDDPAPQAAAPAAPEPDRNEQPRERKPAKKGWWSRAIGE